MSADIRIEKTTQGYEVLINGKMVHLYVGSQDARTLYEEMKRSYGALARELELQRATRDWWRRIEAGAASDNFIDALILTIEAYIRKNKSRRKNR